MTEDEYALESLKLYQEHLDRRLEVYNTELKTNFDMQIEMLKNMHQETIKNSYILSEILNKIVDRLEKQND